MSTGFPLIDLAGGAGDAIGRGLLGFQQGREAKRKSRGEEAIAAFAAGDHARALQLAKEADAVQGLAGPLSPPREAPTLKGTMTTQPGAPLGAAPSPRGLAASMPTPGTPTPAFGLGLDLGNAASLPTSLTPPPAEPNMGLAGLAAYQPTAAPVTAEDRSRPDWNDAGNQEAVRKFVGAPLPKLTQMDPYKDVVEEGTGRVVRKGAENPYRLTADEQASLRREGWDAAMGRTKYTVGATGERQDKAIGAASARQDKAIGAAAQRQATAIGARPAAGSQQNQRAWAQHVADFGRDFPGIGITSTRRSPAHNKAVGGVPGSYHLSGMAFDAGIPPKASQQAVRQWAAGRGMELIEESDHWHFEPRTGTPAAPPKPAAAKPAKLVTDASGVRVPDAPGVKVKDPTAPKPAKPFDAAKAGRSVRAQMGLRASERIRPDRKAEYDRLMAAEQQAHSRSQNGGKTALQMLLEMPD